MSRLDRNKLKKMIIQEMKMLDMDPMDSMGMMGGGSPMTMAQLRSAAKQKGMMLSPMKAAKGGAAKKKK